MKRNYIVTLWKHEDLEDFYAEMEAVGHELVDKRPISRNTEYRMNPDQAMGLKTDSRVRDVELTYKEQGIVVVPEAHYVITDGEFYRDNQSLPTNADLRDWGKLFCAGTEAQRRKPDWGHNAGPDHTATDTITVFDDGKHVDIVIVDDNASYDCEEWKSPTTNQTRFVQYDWYNELRQYGVTVPSGSYNGNYRSNATNGNYHATHVMSTAGGKHYGWAREANLYSLDYLNNQDYFNPIDLLRAFHKNKPINPVTGKRNPTVTNHSYGAVYFTGDMYASNCYQVYSNSIEPGKVTPYTPLNPGPSGWTPAGLEKDFGISNFGSALSDGARDYCAYTTANESDYEDAIADGVILIGAAGNENCPMIRKGTPGFTDSDWFSYSGYPRFKMQGSSSGGAHAYYSRKGSTTSAGMIVVGALDTDRHNLRAYFSNYGPRIDVWAPGMWILGAFNSNGIQDSKYGGNNYYRAISGTSMASPQVCGVAACLAATRERFTHKDMLDWIDQNSWDIGADGETELDFNGEHNVDDYGETAGRYRRQYAGTGNNSNIRVHAMIDPDIASGTSASGGIKYCGQVDNPRAGSANSGQFYMAQYRGDRWIGKEAEEQYTGPKDWDIHLYEGDAVYFVYPNRICAFDVRESNTTDGWVFKYHDGVVQNDYQKSPWAPGEVQRPVHIGDRSYRDFGVGISGNPTLHLVQGDTMVVRGISPTHPFIVKTAGGVGSANSVTEYHCYNNGAYRHFSYSDAGNGMVYARWLGWRESFTQYNGEMLWHTEFTTPGTYYYQCENHQSMIGQIIIHPKSTAFNDHKIYIKTAQSVDTTSDLVTGQRPGDVVQGAAGETNPIDIETFTTNCTRWITRPGDAGTYYWQAGSYEGGGRIIIEPIPGPGSFQDGSCSKGAPTKFLKCFSPRRTRGRILKQVGRRNGTQAQKYPRKPSMRRKRQ